jgi:hypothetical protein
MAVLLSDDRGMGKSTGDHGIVGPLAASQGSTEAMIRKSLATQ